MWKLWKAICLGHISGWNVIRVLLAGEDSAELIWQSSVAWNKTRLYGVSFICLACGLCDRREQHPQSESARSSRSPNAKKRAHFMPEWTFELKNSLPVCLINLPRSKKLPRAAGLIGFLKLFANPNCRRRPLSQQAASSWSEWEASALWWTMSSARNTSSFSPGSFFLSLSRATLKLLEWPANGCLLKRFISH